MNLYFRLLYILLVNLLRPTRSMVPPHFEICTSFRVLPHDLDINMHMNNGRYLTIMDLARVDLMGKIGILRPMIRRRWFPVVGSAQLMYLRPLNPLQKYHIYSRVEYWDEKWFVIEQRFEVKGKIFAQGRIRGLMRNAKDVIPPDEVLKVAGHEIQRPPMTAALKEWLQTVSLSAKK